MSGIRYQHASDATACSHPTFILLHACHFSLLQAEKALHPPIPAADTSPPSPAQCNCPFLCLPIEIAVFADKRNVYSVNMQGPARKAVVVPPWSQAEDALLSAIVFEFGANWSLVSDIMSSTTEILGVYRRPDSCQAHFRQNLVRSCIQLPENELGLTMTLACWLRC